MKKYTLTNFSETFDVYPLEIDGPTAVSSPRQIVSVNTGTSTFRFGGYLLYRLVPGFTFTVGRSADGTLDGVYTVVSSSLWVNGTEDVKAPVVAATTTNVTPSGVFVVDGVSLTAGDRVLLMGQTDPAENGIYDVAAGPWSRASDYDSQPEIETSAVYVLYGDNYGETVWKTTTAPLFTLGTTPIVFTQHIGNVYTDATVVEPIPTPTGSLGSITYTIPAHTSLNLFGNNSFDIGEKVNQNIVSLLETFAAPTSPASPMIGQQWYDTSTETFQRYVASYGPGWTGDIDLDTFQLKFKDVENGNTDIVMTAADGETGLSVKAQTSPPSGQSIFRILSADNNERFDVQHDGYVASTNSLFITGTTLANVLRGKLIVSPSKTTSIYSVDVDGNVNIDTGDVQFDNQYGIVSGTGKFLKSDATGNTWQMTGSFAVNTDDLFVNETNGRVGINTSTPTVGLDVNTTVHIASTTVIDGATTIHNSLTVDDDLIVNTTTNVLYVDSAGGLVGINKVPTVALDVQGDVIVSGTGTIGGDFSVDTNVLFVDTTTNRVGINTATPGSALHVIGDANITASVNVDGNTFVVDSTNNRVGINQGTPTVALDVVGATNIAGTTNITLGDFIVDTTTLVVDSTNNRVGVNTVPTFPLHVVGAANIIGDVGITGDLTVSGTNFTFTGDTLLDGNVEVTGDFVIDAVNNVLYVDTAGGLVGINTVPTTQLDVDGGVHATGVVNFDNDFRVDSDLLFVDFTNQRVGINTAVPGYVLDVTGQARVSRLGVGGGAQAYFGILNTGTLSGDTTQYADRITNTFDTSCTVAARGVSVALSTEAGTYTIPSLQSIRVDDVSKGAGCTIQDNIGILVTDQTTGDTNIGISSRVTSGVDKWNLHIDGTANNHIQGSVLIGTTTDDGSKLQVNGDISLVSATPVIKFPDGDFAYGEPVAPADGDYLRYNATASRWENVTVTEPPVHMWAIVTGATGAIVSDFGITSVTRTGTGVYDVVMDTTFASANDYIVNLTTHSTSPAHISYANGTTTGFTVYTFSATSNLAADINFVLHVVGMV